MAILRHGVRFTVGGLGGGAFFGTTPEPDVRFELPDFRASLGKPSVFHVAFIKPFLILSVLI